ncbi:MAG: hypothetical protein K2G64_01090, partial [Muribaculaceae bacterium]|nr:hypothetical protein [Muribaculaceae bacterium]
YWGRGKIRLIAETGGIRERVRGSEATFLWFNNLTTQGGKLLECHYFLNFAAIVQGLRPPQRVCINN